MSRSRPGSAQTRHSGDRPVAAPRRSSVSEREAFMTDCKAAYLAVFDDLDTDIASRKELCTVLQQAGRSPTNRMLEKYWKSNTDSLSFEDFCDICRSEPETTEDDLMKAFRKIDVNGDGFISNAELKKMLTTRGDKLSTREVQDIIDEVDENGDGKLNYKEFTRMILKTKEECRALAHRNLEGKQSVAPANSSKTSQPSPKPSRNDGRKSSLSGNSERTGKLGSQASLRSNASVSVGKISSRRNSTASGNSDDSDVGSTTSVRQTKSSADRVDVASKVSQELRRDSKSSIQQEQRETDLGSQITLKESRDSPTREVSAENATLVGDEGRKSPVSVNSERGDKLGSQASLRSNHSVSFGQSSQHRDRTGVGNADVSDMGSTTSVRQTKSNADKVDATAKVLTQRRDSKSSIQQERRESESSLGSQNTLKESRDSLTHEVSAAADMRSQQSYKTDRLFVSQSSLRSPRGSNSNKSASTKSALQADESSDSDDNITRLKPLARPRASNGGLVAAKPPAVSSLSRQHRGSQSSLLSLPLASNTGSDSEKQKHPKMERKYEEESVKIALGKSNSEDESSDDDIVIGTARSTSHHSDTTPRKHFEDPAKSLSTVREWSKAAISRQLNVTKPKTLREWKMCKSKGSFFFNSESKIISHQYSLRVTLDTNVWITVEPLCIRPGGDLNSSCEVNGAPMDVMVFVLNTDDTLVAFSEQRDTKGKYALSCELAKGVYKVLAFTTGCRFKKRASEARQTTELVRRKDGKATLTKAFKDALFDIFEMCDLTGNGLWSRDEFRLYNLLTCDQELDDAEWQVVEDKIEMSDGQITKQGFLNLIQMEADDLDPEDKDEDLWVTLESFGFGKSLIMDEVSPFLLEVYAEKCSPVLKVTKLEPGGKMLTNAIIQMVNRKGAESRVKGSKDLFLHSYVTDFRISLVIENRTSTRQSVTVDCHKSQNATSSQPSGLQCTVDIAPKAAVVAHHLMPIKESLAWSVLCAESVK